MNNITNLIQGIPLDWYIFLSISLFSIGVLGVLLRRNAIIAFMSIELMLNAVNLMLTAFSTYLRSLCCGESSQVLPILLPLLQRLPPL